MGGGDTCCGFAGCGRAGEELALSEAEREAKRTEYAAAAAERVTKRGTATTSGLDGRVEVCDGDPRVMGLSRAMEMWSYGAGLGDRWPVGEWSRVTLDGFEVDGAKLSASLMKEYGRHPMDPSAVCYRVRADGQRCGAYWLRTASRSALRSMLRRKVMLPMATTGRGGRDSDVERVSGPAARRCWTSCSS
ncbi:uncharacterized protein AMSG_11627 [Thecamonas trahens ATCC 50062]|uniref:Uncharacterized protein n=1 Tax=Thecamonas trahens ATCC 50062 TaxID=461836 RepID=A0A0L0DER5_THETB|nr:hypothetical protein AMSG_11627 [Thecamonas trahens ATCC 50062]KNC50710.1 hypothetical protein AMSG_11627 [Thecamonas trahens ATCC 50062]|eukprot:XP_013762606.1 hypothetical protein AMSG_11627 [Thecamonas trahens ATCC 50062]